MFRMKTGGGTWTPELAPPERLEVENGKSMEPFGTMGPMYLKRNVS